jgi:hypothetical protein
MKRKLLFTTMLLLSVLGSFIYKSKAQNGGIYLSMEEGCQNSTGKVIGKRQICVTGDSPCSSTTCSSGTPCTL